MIVFSSSREALSLFREPAPYLQSRTGHLRERREERFSIRAGQVVGGTERVSKPQCLAACVIEWP